MKKIFSYMMPSLMCLVLLSCKKDYLETAPSNAEDVAKVFSTTAGAFVALDGIYRIHYSSLTDHGNFGQKAYDLVSDLMGSDMTVHTAGYGWFNTDYRYTAQLSAATNGRSERMWYYYYRIINNANQILENIDKALGPQTEKDVIKGQALALRANCYFYLVNFFQQTYKGNENKPGVPIYKKSTTIGAPRGTVQQVYDLIIADLTEAETLLTGKTRVNISHINVRAVQGIRARVALVMEDYPTAATSANKARTGYNLMTTAQYSGSGFSSPNTEWIWGVQVITDQATIYASLYSHVDISTGGYAALGTQKKIIKWLYDQIPAGDVRKLGFTAPGTGTSANPDYNQVKLKVPTPGSWAADYLFMRAGEMYLIEAEGLARQGAAQEAAARTVLETLVKARNPAYSAAAFTGTALLDEILLQRRIELWGEGVSLFDVKRLKNGLTRVTGAGNHGASYDPITYTLPNLDPKFLMRIPQREIDANESIEPGDQNPQ
jgi:starch-binding outer membrane protein, SusD/RagB family